MRSIVGWLVAAPILVAMLLAGCSNEPATPSLDGSAPLATETPQHTPMATPTPVAIPTATATPTLVPTPTLTPTPVPTPTPTPTPMPIEQTCLDDPDGPCSPRDVSDFLLFTLRGMHEGGVTVPSVEDVLEKGLYLAEASPVHIAFEGTAHPGSVRCHWRGVARTLSQREESIRFWLGMDDDEPLPSPPELEAEFMGGIASRYKPFVRAQFLPIWRGGFSDEILSMTCYADYNVSRYTLGSGPGNVTVGYNIPFSQSRSYDLLKRSLAAGDSVLGSLPTESEYEQMLAGQLAEPQSILVDLLEGRSAVVFLAPIGAHGDVAIEAWQAIEQWDLQIDDEGTVNAVRYGAEIDDPEYSQTLADLRARITAATASDVLADSRIENINGLTDYYREIGAYADLTPDDGSADTFTPSQPPPSVRTEAPTATPTPLTISVATATPVAAPAGTPTPAGPDRAALVALYDATDGPNWANNSNWLSDRPLGEWHGVTTDGDGRVIGLYLDGNWLSGSIPAELGSLSNLEWLYLHDNQLSGPIPVELGQLSNLQILLLYENRLSGSIPEELSNLSNLEQLYLDDNQLSGSIPEELGSLSNLERLSLGGNELSGSIPEELSNLGKLEWLSLDSNQVSGPIPTELGGLSNLQWLWLHDNRLSGAIPVELGNLSNLQDLLLSGNDLSGPIPVELGSLSNLEGLDLDDNQLSGAIPAELGNLSNLQTLYLRANQLTGSIPAELSSLYNLEWLDLYGNELSGSVPAELASLSNLTLLVLRNNSTLTGPLPGSFTGLNSLTTLWLDGTELCAPTDDGFQAWLQGVDDKSGVVNCDSLDPVPTPASPDRAALVALYEATGGSNWANNSNWLSDRPLGAWHGVTTDGDGRVTGLDLNENQLSGPIPAELGSLYNLESLGLSVNQLNGPIPTELGGLANLESLSLSGNELSGSIPVELGSLSNLEQLGLGFNKLSGSIPTELGNLANLEGLGLGFNKLSGSIPSELGSLSNLQRLSLYDNELSGLIPAELGSLSKLRVLYLSGNKLSGSIPAELAGLASLRELWLSDNQLSGPIPAELGSLTNLEQLSLGGNELSGPVPAELGSLSKLTLLILRHNPALSGPLPRSLTGLNSLVFLWPNSTGLCAPTDAMFQTWLQGVEDRFGVVNCMS